MRLCEFGACVPVDMCVQRLEVMVSLMLARDSGHERPAPTGAAVAGCTALAAALIGLPSRSLEMIAEAVAVLGYADVCQSARMWTGAARAVVFEGPKARQAVPSQDLRAPRRGSV